MGTFTCRPFSANQTGAGWTFIGGANLLDCLLVSGSGTARSTAATYADSWGISSSPDTGAGISIDGGALISFASVPAGFTVTALQVNARVNFSTSDPPNVGGHKLHLQWQSTNIGSTLLAAAAATDYSATVTPTPTTLGTFFATDFGIAHDGSSGLGGISVLDLDRLWISGTYAITNFQWFLEEIEEEQDGIKFKRDVLTQVFEGDPPPEDAVPIGDPGINPTFHWWHFEADDIELWLYQPNSPGTLWVIDIDPDDYGWWKSFEEFLGGALLIVRGNPKKPRTFEEIEDYSDFMGGFPGAGAVYNHKLVYAARDYADAPIVRIFDGISDRELARIPAVATVESIAIISMTAINGQVYLTTYDSGVTDTTFAGRVFRLDVSSANVVQIGAQFTGGEVPYAVAWHNGMLWCGTNPAGDGAESGKIYSFRPEVDTLWTEDLDLSTPVDLQVAGGCTGLVSFQGKLIVTTCAPSGQKAATYARNIDGTYEWIGEGPDDGTLNMWGSPIVFNDLLYVTYWDSTYGTSVWSYDGNTFSEVLGPLSGTVAFIGLYQGSGNIYALVGGFEQPARLWESEDGTNWDDLTGFLPGQDTQKATPIFAEVRTA